METMMKIFGPMLLNQITPGVRTALTGMVDNLKLKARETSNPWDDLLVAALAALLGLEHQG